MNKHDNKTDQQRRKFLRGTVATGAGAVIVAAAPGVAAATTPDKAEQPAKQKGGYQLSQHVLDYYKTCAR